MNALLTLCAAGVLAVPLLGQTPAHPGMQHDPDKMVPGGGKLPTGWQARLDQAGAKLEGVKFEIAKAGFHITTGPAGIYYQPQAPSGAFQIEATFTQMQPSAHPEAYGVFIGGSDLQGANQKYTYFLIRQDGKYLIKRREGSHTRNVVDWTESAAIVKTDASSNTGNTLSIDVGKEKVIFLVNGTTVTSQLPAQIDTKGIAGLRINHNLDVQVADFKVEAPAVKTPGSAQP